MLSLRFSYETEVLTVVCAVSLASNREIEDGILILEHNHEGDHTDGKEIKFFVYFAIQLFFQHFLFPFTLSCILDRVVPAYFSWYNLSN